MRALPLEWAAELGRALPGLLGVTALATIGPVLAAAVILPPYTASRGADYSKRLTAERRDLFRRPLTTTELDRFDAVVHPL